VVEEKLEQPEDSMFSRNAGHIARRGREVSVAVVGFDEPKVGFLAGLDEEYVQICLTTDQTLANVHRQYIVSMDETGNTIGSFIKAGMDPDITKRIQEKTVNFQKRASYLYGRKQDA
jgi:hypothetical protein